MAKEPSYALKWLLLAPNEKTCAIGPSTWAPQEIELAIMILIHEEHQTTTTQDPPAPPTNRSLAMIFKVRGTRHKDGSYQKVEVKPQSH